MKAVVSGRATRTRHKSPAAAVAQGLLAGVIGNAIFTGYQALIGRGDDGDGSPPKDWSETPEPAQVGQRVSEGVFEHELPVEKAGLVTTVVHWLYGTAWGGVYALVEESVRRPAVSAPLLSTTVVATDYTLLPLMNLYKPPWRYPARTLAKDFGHHLVYGFAVAGAYKALDLAFD
jgi:uncharacterized membrane protein YagU involved in acid resistance